MFKKVARRTRETVKARHKQGVAVVKAAYRARQFGAFGFRPAGRFLENLLGSGGAQLLHLRVNALAVRRIPSHSRKSWVDSAPDFRNRKAIFNQRANFGAKVLSFATPGYH